MKATGNYEQVKNVDPLVVLTEHTRHHIDHWLGKFPPDRKRSALIQALFAAQEQNNGFLTDELIAAVAKYLDVPTVWAYEVASFYSMLETKPVGRNNVADLHQHLVLAQRWRRYRASLREEARHQAWRKHGGWPRLSEARRRMHRCLRRVRRR